MSVEELVGVLTDAGMRVQGWDGDRVNVQNDIGWGSVSSVVVSSGARTNTVLELTAVVASEPLPEGFAPSELGFCG